MQKEFLSRRDFLRRVALLAGTLVIPDTVTVACQQIAETPSSSPAASLAPIRMRGPDTLTATPTLVIYPTPSPTPKLSPAIETERKVLRDNFIWKGDSKKPNVALTIDDGWIADSIKKITNILKETGVRLTVFPAGQAIDAFHALWKELYNMGCEFGCHSYSHPRGFAQMEVSQMVSEIKRSQNALDRAVGKHAEYRFFRPPGGAISWNVVEALKETNLTGVIWTLSGEGTSRAATSASIIDRIVPFVAPGYITLQHFIPKDADALSPIIAGCLAKGLRPTTLSAVL